jgi:hypothetical protein
VVTNLRWRAHDGQQTQPEASASVDICPSMSESGLPFYAFGSLPQLFDAPCRNLGDSAELRWTADTFLTTVPLRSRDEGLSWLAGFRWGYTESDIPGQKPVLLPLEITGAQAWNEQLPVLQRECGNWRFAPAG